MQTAAENIEFVGDLLGQEMAMNDRGLRILVIGAGVNGSVVASELHRAGYDVTVLARGKRFEELVVRGIEIEDPLKGIKTVTKVPVIDTLVPEDVYEYILVVVRKNQAGDLLPSSYKTSRRQLSSW